MLLVLLHAARSSEGINGRADLQLLKHGRREGVPRAGHAAADDVHGKIQRVHHPANADGQRAADLLVDSLSRYMALNGKLVDSTRGEFDIAARSVGQILGVASGNRLVCHADNGGRGSILFEAATAATTARMPFR